MSASVTIRQDEVVQAAEIFAGGFGGWGRAVSLLADSGVRVRNSWCLEREGSCVPPLVAQHPEAVVARCEADLPVPDDASKMLQLHTDFEETWWRLCCANAPTFVAFPRHVNLGAEPGKVVCVRRMADCC